MSLEAKNLNERQAADYLGVSVKTLQLWRHQRKGPVYVKLGRRVAYFGLDLMKYLDEQRVRPSIG